LKSRKFLSLILMIGIMTFLGIAIVTFASTEAQVSIVTDSNTYMKDAEFTANVYIQDNISNLVTADVQLSYDPTQLQVVSLTEGGLLGGTGKDIVKKVFDNTLGNIWFSISNTNGPTLDNNGGILLAITFKALEPGEANISFTKHPDAPIGPISLVDNEVNDINFTSQSKTITISAPDTEGPEIFPMSPQNGETVGNKNILISAEMFDQSGVDESSIQLAIDGSNVSGFTFNSASGMLEYTVASLSAGSHTIKVTAEDVDGRSNYYEWTFNVADVPTPQVDKAEGTYYSSSINVKFTNDLTGCDVYYTTNGDDPDTSDSLYSANGIDISGTGTVTLKAIAYNGTIPGEVATFQYTFGTFSSSSIESIPAMVPGENSFKLSSPRLIELVGTCDDAKIKYNFDNGTVWTEYPQAGIEVTDTTTIYAKWVSDFDDQINSQVYTFNYVMDPTYHSVVKALDTLKKMANRLSDAQFAFLVRQVGNLDTMNGFQANEMDALATVLNTYWVENISTFRTKVLAGDSAYLVSFFNAVRDEIPLRIKESLNNLQIGQDTIILVGLDVIGSGLDLMTINQDLKNAVDVILDNHGILDDKAAIAALGFKFANWQAYLTSMSTQDQTDMKDIMKEMAPSVVKSVEISGPTVIEVAPGGSASVDYNAIVKDQYGDAMTGETVQWSTDSTSIPVNTEGLVTVASSAIGTEFTLNATSTNNTSIYGTLTVQVKATSLSLASEAVEIAEGSKNQGDVDTARALVNALPDGPEKTDLTERLNAVQNQIDKDAAINAAKAAIDALPSPIILSNEGAVATARNLVNIALTKGATNADISNLAKLVDAEQVIQVLKEAQKITSIQNPVQDATSLTLPSVPDNYLISIKSSSKPSVVATDGKITPPAVDTQVSIVLTLFNKTTGKSASTVAISITVPQSKAAKDAAEQAAVNQAAAGVTSIATPAKDATTLTLPTVSGYTVAIKSSTNTGVIAVNGTITPPNTVTTVGIVLTLTSQTTQKTADTAVINVVVPQSSAGDALAAATLKVQAAEALILDLSTLAKVTAAQTAKTAADEAVAALADSAAKTALVNRLTAVQTAINNANAALEAPNRMGITGARLVEVNKSIQYSASVFNKKGINMNVGSGQITWESSNPSVATVSNSGLVTGVAVGTTIITARYETLSITANVEVFRIPDLVVTGIINGAKVNRDVTITAYCVGKDITIDQGTAQNGMAQETYTTEGTHTVTVEVQELNKTETVTFTIDKTAPTVAITNAATVENEPAGVTPTVNFDGDYVASTRTIQLNGKPYDGSAIKQPGTYTLTASVQDAAGNLGFASKSFEVKWDTAVPAISINGVLNGEIYGSATPVITLSGGSNQGEYTYTATLTNPNGDSEAFTSGQQITAPGSYKLTVNAVNPSYVNFTAFKTVEFTIDSEAPIVEITGIPGNVSKAAVTPIITMTDDVASQAVLSQKAVATLTRNGNNAPYKLGDTIKNDGVYQLTIKTYDGLDEVSNVATASFTIDGTAPVINLSGVLNGYSYKDRDVVITATTNEGTLTVTNNGTAINLNGNQYTFTGNANEVFAYALVLKATDAAGNTTERKVNFTIDRLPVNIVVTGVTEGKITNDDLNISFTTYKGTVVGPGSTTATIDGSSFSGGSYSVAGTHKLLVKYAEGGNSYEKEVNFTIDKTAPVVTITNTLKNDTVAAGDIYVKAGNTVKVKASVTETVSLKEVYFAVGPNKVTMDKQQDGSYEGTWTVGSGSHSNYTLSVFAKDTAGNTGKVDRTGKISIDNTKPSVSRFTNPAQPGGNNGFYKAANMTVTLEAGTGETINYNLNGTTGTATGTVTLSPAQGSNVLTYSAVDQAGNTSDQNTFRFQYDSVAPSDVILTTDATGLTNASSLTVNGQVIGEGGKGTKVVMRKSGEVVGTADVTNDGTFAIPGVALAEGTNSFTLRAVDTAGNTSANAVTLTRILDTTKPVLTVSKVDDTHYSVTVNESVTDVNASFNGVEIDSADISGPNSGVYNIVTPDPVSGTNYLEVTAADDADNIGSGSFTSTYIPPATVQNNLPIASNATMDIPSDAFPDGTTQLTVKTGQPVEGLMLKGLGAPISFSFSVKPEEPVTVRMYVGSGLKGVALFHINDEGEQDKIDVLVFNNTDFEQLPNLVEDTAYYIEDTGYLVIKTKKFSDYQPALDDADPEIAISTTDFEIDADDAAKIEGTITDADPDAEISEVLVNNVAMDLTNKDTDKNFSITLTNLVQGTNEVTITAVDSAGNSSSITRTYEVDTVAPVVSASAATNLTSAQTVALTVTVDESSEVFINSESKGTFQGTKSISVSLSEGNNTFNIVAKDALQNASNTATVSVTRDSIAPEIAVDGVSEGDIYGSSRIITVTANEGLTPDVTIDGVDFNNGQFSAEGQHTLTATATDTAGNTTTIDITFTIDTSVPEISIGGVTGGERYSSDKLVVVSTNDANLVVTKSVDNGAAENVTVTGTTANIDLSVAEGEEHSFTVQATATKMVGDDVRIATSTVNFIIDKKKPIITIGGVSDGATYTNAVTITVTANEGITPEVTIDGAAFVSGTQYSALGDHTLVATATDVVGNISTVTITFTITAPSSGGGGGGGDDSSAANISESDVTKQLNSGKNEITFTAPKGTATVEIKASTYNKIADAGKDLVINTDSVSFRIPAGAFAVSGTSTKITFDVDELKDSTAKKYTDKLESDYDALSKVFDITTSSAPETELTVTISYDGLDLTGVNEDMLDVYWFNESTGKWVAMKGTVNKADNTIEFVTTHFSKYAVIEFKGSDTTGSFADIKDHWAKDDIQLMVSKGIIKGISATEFAPNTPITRAQFAALLVRALGLETEADYQLVFDDVAKSQWYYGEVAAAFKAGIIKGKSATSFAPNANITREEIAAMMARAMETAGKGVELTDAQVQEKLAKFTDAAKIASWAKSEVAQAVELGIVNGRTENTFVAKANATRAESAVMIKRMYEQLD